RRKSQRELSVLIGERGTRDDLRVVFSRSPGQRNLDLAARSSAKINPPVLFLAIDQSKARLLDTVRRGGVERDARALVAHKRFLLVHDNHVFGADRMPLAKPHAEWATLRPGRSFGLLGSNREVEFSVIEHLSPK